MEQSVSNLSASNKFEKPFPNEHWNSALKNCKHELYFSKKEKKTQLQNMQLKIPKFDQKSLKTELGRSVKGTETNSSNSWLSYAEL